MKETALLLWAMLKCIAPTLFWLLGLVLLIGIALIVFRLVTTGQI